MTDRLNIRLGEKCHDTTLYLKYDQLGQILFNSEYMPIEQSSKAENTKTNDGIESLSKLEIFSSVKTIRPAKSVGN